MRLFTWYGCLHELNLCMKWLIITCRCSLLQVVKSVSYKWMKLEWLFARLFIARGLSWPHLSLLTLETKRWVPFVVVNDWWKKPDIRVRQQYLSCVWGLDPWVYLFIELLIFWVNGTSDQCQKIDIAHNETCIRFQLCLLISICCSVELMTELLGSSDLVVIQVEMDLYSMLRKVYLYS